MIVPQQTTPPVICLKCRHRPISLRTERRPGASLCLARPGPLLQPFLSRLLPTLASLFGYGISFFLLSKVLDIVPMGISYGIWSGIGIVLVSLMGLLFFGQKLDLAACLGLGLIVLGVLVIHFFSGSMPH